MLRTVPTAMQLIITLLSFSILVLPIFGAITQLAISSSYIVSIVLTLLLIFSVLIRKYKGISYKEQVKLVSFAIIFCLLPLLIAIYYSIFKPAGDTEWYYVPIIVHTGHTWHLLELREPLYYALWPIPQITAACMVELANIDVFKAYVSLFIYLYEAFIITVYVIAKRIKTSICSDSVPYYVMLSLISVYYLHRAFHDLMQDAFGMYSLLLVSYIAMLIVTSNKQQYRRAWVLLLVFISVLMIAHGAAIYLTSILLLLLTMFTYVTRHTKISLKLILVMILVFTSTYMFQLSSGLLSSVVYEVQSRLMQLLNALLERGLSRPSGQANINIKQQQEHFVYPYHSVTVPVAYVSPAVLCTLMLAVLVVLAKSHTSRSSLEVLDVQMLTFTLFSLIMLGTALVFGYYGIENAIARYLYLYGSVVYPIIFVYTCLRLNQNTKLCKYLRLIFELAALVILICWITEVFYIPWFSLYKLFDLYQLRIRLTRNIFDYIYHVKLKPLLLPGVNARYYFLPPNIIKQDLVYSSDVFSLSIS